MTERSRLFFAARSLPIFLMTVDEDRTKLARPSALELQFKLSHSASSLDMRRTANMRDPKI